MPECPCSSRKDYTDCCEPYVTGKTTAPMAEALMRSRYTAYAKQRLDYLWDTLLPRTRSDHDPESTRDWAKSSRWLGLEIVAVDGGKPEDSKGTVEFIARYERDGETQSHHELASFRREENRWYFEQGKVVGQKPEVREAPKVGRNDPCPCGSGKKHKKCCGR